MCHSAAFYKQRTEAFLMTPEIHNKWNNIVFSSLGPVPMKRSRSGLPSALGIQLSSGGVFFGMSTIFFFFVLEGLWRKIQLSCNMRNFLCCTLGSFLMENGCSKSNSAVGITKCLLWLQQGKKKNPGVFRRGFAVTDCNEGRRNTRVFQAKRKSWNI